MSECQGGTVPNETYTVIVRIPKPLTTRVTETWTRHRSCCRCMFTTFLLAFVSFIFYFLLWLVEDCHKGPGMSLDYLSIDNMAVYQNNTKGALGPQWQVDSALNVSLSTWNDNTVAGCFITYRRVIVRVEYRGQTILQQEVPLGFGLKPRGSLPVDVEVQEQHAQLKNPDVGLAMAEDLQSGTIIIDVYFDTRYLRNDRKAGWLRFGCVVIFSSFSTTSSYDSFSGTLFQDQCYPT